MSKLNQLIALSQTGDKQATDRLVCENSGLIWSVVKRYLGRGTDAEDLYQIGCVGFLKAIDGFNTEYGTQFSTYAVPKISGEIRRFLRDDGTIKVSRGIKERAVLINTVRNRLIGELRREPTIVEISEKTGLSVEEIAVADSAMLEPESIQQSDINGFTLENVLTNTEGEDSMLERISLRQAIDQLNDREAFVIRLRYYHGLTQQQISKILNVSQVQVSRIEKKVILKLREYLNEF